MTFNPNIPQPNDDPTASQADLLGNFGKLNTDWAVNHTPLTSGGNNGFHKMIQFPNVLSADPSVTGLQSAVYPKLGPDSLPALFFKNATNTYQLTQLPVVVSGNNRGVKTPWGFSINAGTIPSGITSVTYAIPFSNGQTFTIELTAQGSGTLTNYSVTTNNNNGFTLNTQVASAFYYIAIGN
jgi:hypothetical protein